MASDQGRAVLVVTDGYLAKDHTNIDATFLESDPWTGAGAWGCDGPGPGGAPVTAFRAEAIE